MNETSQEKSEYNKSVNRRRFVQLAGGTGVAALAGCQGDGNGGGDGGDDGNGGDDDAKTTMEFWHDKGDWQDFYAEVLSTLNEDIIEGNTTVEQVPKTGEYQAALRPVLGNENGPGIFTWWAGARLRQLVEDDFAYDVTDIWQKYVDDGAYPEALIDTFGVDGTAYAIPNNMAYWVVWYRAETFESLGVKPPSTWDEFMQVCDTILEESGGDTKPLTIPLTSEWTAFTWWEELVIGQDPDYYDAVCAGDASYTDEPSVEAFRKIGEMVKNDYFGETDKLFSYEFPDSIRQMEQENYAMMLMGDWVSSPVRDVGVDFESWDWFAVPSLDESVGKQMVVEPGPIVPHAAYGNKEALDSVVDAMLSKEFRQALSEKISFIPAHNEVGISHLPANKQRLAESLGDFSFSLRYWENAPPEVAPPAASTMTKIFSKPDDAESIAEEVDQVRKNNQ